MNKIIGTHQNARRQDSEHWVSMSDLMAGLMMVFLFISVAYMHYVRIEKEKIKEVAVAYQNAQAALYMALEKEFSQDLEKWDAEIDKQTLEFRFKSPEVLFGLGSVELKSSFKKILDDFFPRYLKVLDKFKEHITDIRIEAILAVTGQEPPLPRWHIFITWNYLKGELVLYCNTYIKCQRLKSIGLGLRRFFLQLGIRLPILYWTKMDGKIQFALDESPSR